MFGDGTRLSEAFPSHIEPEPAEHRHGAGGTHLRYRIIRRS
jgi:hypothetical protein